MSRSRLTVESAVRAAVQELAASPAFRGTARDGQPHLRLAAAALAVADAADRLAREEVMAARQRDSATWEMVGDALGVSRQAAHERFRAGPDGLHSRWSQKPARQKSDGSSGVAAASTGGESSVGRRRATERS
jgi:hypothetical protein